jgi:hypothetical protein
MGESLAIPDLWDTISVHDAHIQSLKALKSDYDALVSQKQEDDKARGESLARLYATHCD